MSAGYPQLIDPWQAAAREASFSGEVALDVLPRLRDMIAGEALDTPVAVSAAGKAEASRAGESSCGEAYGARFSAVFGLDAHRRPLIQLQVEAVVPLRCQRTLRVFAQKLHAESQVVIVTSPEEAERVDEALEPVLLEQPQLALRELVEEEILLALPLVPLAPGSEGAVDPVPQAAPAEPRRKPFAGLDELLARAEGSAAHASPAGDGATADSKSRPDSKPR